MSVGVVNPAAPEPLAVPVYIEQVVGVAEAVAPLAQHRAAVGPADLLRRRLHVCLTADGLAGENLRLGDVGGEEGCHGKKLPGEGTDGLGLHEPCPAGGHHPGVYHQVFCLMGPQPAGNGADQAAGGDHADFHRIGTDVLEHGVDLLGQKLGGYLKNSSNAQGVLGGESGDGAHGVDPVHGHGFDIRLDSCAAAGIAAGDGQRCFHCRASFSGVNGTGTPGESGILPLCRI